MDSENKVLEQTREQTKAMPRGQIRTFFKWV